MSDVVVLSSDDSEPEKVVKETCVKEEIGTKRRLEHPSSSAKKQKIKPTYLGTVKKDVKEISKSNGSLSPPTENHEVVFNEFVDICLELDSTHNMKKIIEKKVKKYYSLLVPDYRSSEQFIDFLERKGVEMQRSPSQRFIHLKEVVDELSVHRSDKINSTASTVSDRFIRKLCKAMELLHRKIKKLEEKEVDWEEDSDSTYIQLQRYRERVVKIHAKLQELEGNSASVFCRKISFSGTQFPKVNRTIEKYVNAKGEFPDFNDIHDLLKTSYHEENIEISKESLRREAKSVFEDIGEQLQKIRKSEFWEAHRTFLEDDDNDPADGDDQLRVKLDENKKKFQESIDEIINSYVEKKHKKSQFASEDSNSSEGVKKEVNSENENREKEEEGEEAEEDEEEDNDDSDEENENEGETMDDILCEIEEEEPEDTMDTPETIFLNCAPVSPPTSAEGGTDSDHLSQLSSPGLPPYITTAEDSNEETRLSGEITVVEEDSDIHSIPGCSKWENNEKQEIKTGANKHNEANSKTVKQEPEVGKPFIKVRSLQSLQCKVHQSVPEEILLD